MLSLLGGIVGIALGFGVSTMFAKFAGWPVIISPLAVALAFLVSVSVGIFFGFYPAKKASGLSPIEALRYE
jgi:putative ABC transport system permease protein